MHPIPRAGTLCLALLASPASALLPLVVNTWAGPFTAATDAAFTLLHSGHPPLDAVQAGCATCERHQCDGTVGYGGSPDEDCETTLDALLMDGATLNAGAVANLRRVRDAVATARLVLDRTRHTLLAGDQATRFAVENGLSPSNLSTPDSLAACHAWRDAGCQPNYRVGTGSSTCGPYTSSQQQQALMHRAQASHDTISQIAVDSSGHMAAGTSTNGASHKVPGRVGDGPIPGSGSYADDEAGACGATGDGDVMMRFLPCYQAVESLRRGMTPSEAARDAVSRMVRRYPDVQSGVVVVDREGNHAAAASGWVFTYAYRGGDMDATQVVTVQPIQP